MSAQDSVQFDSASSAQSGASAVSSLSWNHTVASESNRVILIAVAWKDQSAGGISVADATFNGVSINSVISSIQTTLNDVFLEVYLLKTPAIGTHTVTITWTDTGATAVGMAASYFNVYLPNPISISQVATGTTNPITNTVTLAGATDITVDFVTAFKASSALALTAGADQTQDINTESVYAGNHIIGASSHQTTLDGVMSWTESINKEWASIALILAWANTQVIFGCSPGQFLMGAL